MCVTDILLGDSTHLGWQLSTLRNSDNPSNCLQNHLRIQNSVSTSSDRCVREQHMLYMSQLCSLNLIRRNFDTPKQFEKGSIEHTSLYTPGNRSFSKTQPSFCRKRSVDHITLRITLKILNKLTFPTIYLIIVT